MQDTLSDADKDGLTALTEYAIGTDPKKVSPESGFEIRVDELEIEELVQEFLIVDITRRVGADDINFKIFERSFNEIDGKIKKPCEPPKSARGLVGKTNGGKN